MPLAKTYSFTVLLRFLRRINSIYSFSCLSQQQMAKVSCIGIKMSFMVHNCRYHFFPLKLLYRRLQLQ